MSPAVKTATASAAAAIAPKARRSVTSQQDAGRPKVEQSRLFQLGLDRAQPDAHDQDDPRQGRQRVHERGPDATDQDRPDAESLEPARVAKRTQPGRRMQGKRHECRQANHGQQQPAAPERRCERGRRPAERPRGRAIASVAATSETVSIASVSGRAIPPGSREQVAAEPAGSSEVPVAGSACSRSAIARAGLADRRDRRPADDDREPGHRMASQSARDRLEIPAHVRNPASRIRAAVFSYASVDPFHDFLGLG